MSKKYDYNKSDIANIVEEFKALLVEHDCADDVCIYYNKISHCAPTFLRVQQQSRH